MRANTIYILILVILSSIYGQNDLPIIKSNSELISIREGDELQRNSWRLAPEAKPDVYQASLIEGKAHRVTFISDVDSMSFLVEENKTYDFIIHWNNQDCYTQIVGRRFIPAARFNEAYQNKYNGKITIEIPQVYELINIAIAISQFGNANKNFVYQHSGYYKKVKKWFAPHENHPLITRLDSVLSRNSGYYATLKMNGYAFEFNAKGTIIPSPVYDRTGFRNERSNSLKPYLSLMQSFADQSDFLHFYEDNLAVYDNQIIFYRDSADIAEMKNWLDKNFPGSSHYNSYKIIFSPLVAFNQSSTWYESNGFRELQPHVNFPYRRQLRKIMPLSLAAELTYRGNIVFTEINHGYINPESDKYAAQISKAIENRERWVEKKRPANYYRGNAAFIEYMNWGLVTLRILDYVPKVEQEKLVSRVEKMMVNNRGFIRFKEYNRFLMDLYLNRDTENTIADLFPQIIAWFEKENQR